ncbi:7,8-dihydro-8-oxoguanine-triphosphatase [Pseudoalteromonas luteoviolacea]|uniref:8-oxo-dGTP diphosphatase n=1 Tax=Pseudoalteromonas luteoviolacea TaxID=43657 RepID=A0A1C0TNE4_9GAMM|nr:8-oxo-dGTP diphosphatase MutT [Pseudoalteromonas luteoviolacea]OCQ20204.1 7,8-dihydro-8-oxoguanine-triphosphatase [Pseudoalteromonas luteoviolacea]
MTKKVVNVAVGVIYEQGKYFVCKRSEEQHQGGLWEFPGGKVEPQESVELALQRELAEEIGIQVIGSQHLLTIEHDYGDKQVCLHVHVVDQFTGSPTGLEGQPSQWVDYSTLKELEFPKANIAIIDALSTFQ